ncbi:hypothetical protein ACFZCM_03400 [Streptomyces rochei]|uniref:hypothetical protein n=1 Tax=Streptomyces rochei TaxID=1928 RepID=UPI0036EF5B40
MAADMGALPPVLSVPGLAAWLGVDPPPPVDTDALAEIARLTTREAELVAETAARQAEAEEIVVKQQADLDDLTAENDQLRDELAALKVRFGPELAAEANAHPITVPPMIRPVDGPEDQATAPIDVKPLWDALGVRPVTDPGKIA